MIRSSRLGSTLLVVAVALVAACGSSGDGSGASPEPASDHAPGAAAPAVLLVESWRIEDRAIWASSILPRFTARNPDIEVRFAPTLATEYNAAVRERADRGLAGDIIACRPFDESRKLHLAGHLAPLDGLRLERRFPERALEPWSTELGVPYCVPVASVMHGFLANEAIFAALGMELPDDQDAFFSVLEKVKSDGRFVPLALGLEESWKVATVGLQNIGPTHWEGERGRRGLIDGSARFSDPEFVEAFATLARWRPFLPTGAGQVSVAQARRLFTEGSAALYPFGSWEISEVSSRARFPYSAVPPPPIATGRCVVTDHVDIGFGINPASPHREQAMRFLRWVADPEFAEVYSNALPGFFSLQSKPVALESRLARELAEWRRRCATTIRSSAQHLSRGDSTHETDLWELSGAVMSGRATPEEAGAEVQRRLDSWYVPRSD